MQLLTEWEQLWPEQEKRNRMHCQIVRHTAGQQLADQSSHRSTETSTGMGQRKLEGMTPKASQQELIHFDWDVRQEQGSQASGPQQMCCNHQEGQGVFGLPQQVLGLQELNGVYLCILCKVFWLTQALFDAAMFSWSLSTSRTASFHWFVPFGLL